MVFSLKGATGSRKVRLLKEIRIWSAPRKTAPDAVKSEHQLIDDTSFFLLSFFLVEIVAAKQILKSGDRMEASQFVEQLARPGFSKYGSAVGRAYLKGSGSTA
jgi:hypothetical protein